MGRPEKVQAIESIAEKMQKAKSIFVTDYSGLNVEQITELRNNLRKESVEYRVVKNTLTRLSVQKVGYNNLIPFLNGPTALAYGMKDPIAPARVIADFAKKIEKPGIKACVIDGVYYDVSRINELIKLPPREVLIGQVVTGFAAPISSFIGALNGIFANLIHALNAIKDKKEQK